MMELRRFSRKPSVARRAWRRGIVGVVLVAATPFGVAAAAAKTQAKAAGAPLVIGYSDPDGAEQGLQSVGYGAQQAIKELHLNWKLKSLNSALSANTQVSNINTFVSLHVAGIMSWTLDPGAVQSAYAEAKRHGIPVIGLNSASSVFASEMAAYTDTTCNVAKQQAAYIARLIPHAKVLAIGGPPVPSITLTSNCFYKAAKKAGLDILATQDDTTSTAQGGQQIASNMLTKYPDAQAVWVFTESTALGAVAALKSAGKTVWSGKHKGVVVVARDGTTAGAAAIKSGNLTATWDDNEPELGAAAIEVLKMIIVNKTPLSRIPKIVPIPSQRWTLANINRYKSPLTRKVTLPAIPKA